VAKINARDWIFQINNGSGTWLDIAGINNFKPDPGANSAVTDGTQFDNAGNYSGRKMQVGASIELSGFFHATGAVRDPGQARIETLHAAVGDANLADFRFRHINQTLWTRWTAIVELSDSGAGGNNDFSAWGAKLTRDGLATTMVAP
jgi:hypothetical protein